MAPSSRGFLYADLPTAEDSRKPTARDDRTQTRDRGTADESPAAPDPDRDEPADDPASDVADTTPTASRANWTGHVPADD